MSVVGGLLRRPTAILAGWLIVGVLGVRAFLTMPIDLFPDTVPPQIVVMTVVRGASAEEVNRLVSSLIDREIKGITGLTRVTATSRDEISSVNAQFDYDRDIGLAMNDVINAVNRIKGQFPAGAQEPQFFRVTDASRPVLTLAVMPRPGSGLDLPAVRLLADNDLREELLALPGVGRVDVFGAHQPEVLVRLDHERLRRYDLTPEAVLAAIGANNLSLPGGYWVNQGRESLVKTVQEARQPADLAALPLRIRQGGIVTVGDVASISLRPAEPRSFYHGNGSPAIALNVLKPEGGYAMAALQAVKEALPRLERRFPGLAFAVTTDQQPIIDRNVAGMKGALVSAVWLTMLVVFVLLLEARTSLVIGLSIPLSFLSAFAFLWFTPFTLNMVTLSGLIIAVGMVVDASIVVAENVFRHLQTDGSTPELVRRGTEEVVFSILGGMLTTVVVMIPIMFVGGYAQQILRPLTMTIAATLIGSFVAALTIVPLALGWFFGGERRPAPSASGASGATGGWLAAAARGMDRLLGGVADIYLTLLEGALRVRLLLLVAGFIALAATVRTVIPVVGRELMPRMDTGLLTVKLDLPPAMPLPAVEATVSRFEEVMRRHPELISLSTVVGAEPGQVSFGAGGQLLQQAEIQVRLTTRDQRTATIWEIMDEWRRAFAAIPGPTAVSVTEYGATPMSTTRAPIDVQISGRDPAVLAALAERTLAALRGIPGLGDLRPAWTLTKPETHLRPVADLVARYGLTPRGLGDFLGVTLTGRVPARLKMPGFLDLPIRVDIGHDGRRWAGDLLELVLPHGTGDLFLSAVAGTHPTLAPTALTREDLRQTSDLLGINLGRPLSLVAADVQQVLDGLAVPEGYEIRLTGSMSDIADTGRRLGGALVIGIVFLYIVLWVLFENWWRPWLVMVSIPLSLIGALWGLVFFDKPMCQPAMMGLILLGGTIVNNAIILIDFIDQARREGMPRRAALFQAVRIRLRPILITTASTVLGLLPLVFEQAVGLERMSPLGIVACFGLAFGTVLTLVLIPAWYDLAIETGEKIRRLWGHPDQSLSQAGEGLP
jgi:multidrug efflux pump subunit AcrB